MIVVRKQLPPNLKSYYDINSRGAQTPDYSPAEALYRADRLAELQNSYVIREQAHMELNNMSYSEYYLINRQMDMAYNPPKVNPADSRLISGLVHEKDQTLISVIMDMNFQPKVKALDPNDRELNFACNIFTAKIKKALLLDNFRDKMEDIARMLVSQGNAFVTNKKYEKWAVQKIKISGNSNDYSKITWRTIYAKECDYCTTEIIPNTAVFPMNIMEVDKKKQPRIYYVMHYPVGAIAQIFKNNPRWKCVPMNPTRTIPVNIDGIWGDYYLQLPTKDFVEVITMESEMYNEYQVWINGVQMFPVQLENGLITGFPLTEMSVSGEFTMAKGDFERIPFFFFSKSNPTKNQVKEEELNEVMRLMVLMLRQKVNPPVGNLSNRVLQSNMWDPGMVISDLKKDDISILNPNTGIGTAEFSFYKMLQESIADSSVSSSVEGNNNADITATQYMDQKKENLKKIGLSLDRTIDLLRQIYWSTLFNEISYVDQKVKEYKTDGTFVEAYQSFSVDDNVNGKKGNVTVNLMDDTSGVDPYAVAKKEADDGMASRIYHAKPAQLKSILKNMRGKIYIDVVAEPEGQQVTLLAALFNILTQYVNLKGGDSRKIDFDYIETIIADNSGFDPDRLFLDKPLTTPGAVAQPNGSLALNQNPGGNSKALATAG